MRRTLLFGFVACVCTLSADSDLPSVQVWADRTAVYPGDQFRYVVEVKHRADIEFVKDHVRKDQLPLAPFEILDITTGSGGLPDGRRFFEVRLLLTTFAVGVTEATIPSFNLFYFRKEQTGTKDNAPAETLAVPPLKLGLRSTVVDPGGTIRARKDVLSIARADWLIAGSAGLVGLTAVAIAAFWGILTWARSGFWKQRSTEHAREKSLRESFDEIRQATLDSPENVDRFYNKASLILRGIAAEQIGECAGLTPNETEEALRRSGDNTARAQTLSALLHECDLVRYSPDGRLRGQSRHSEFLREFEELIARH